MCGVAVFHFLKPLQSLTVSKTYMKSTPAHILIVEDHDDNRMLLQLYLKISGYQVVAATGCGEALKYAQSANFDLCILDHHLPDGSGADLRQSLREFQPQMPVLYWTGTNYGPSHIDSLRQSGDDYLLKPAEPKLLKETVAQLLTKTPAECDCASTCCV